MRTVRFIVGIAALCLIYAPSAIAQPAGPTCRGKSPVYIYPSGNRLFATYYIANKVRYNDCFEFSCPVLCDFPTAKTKPKQPVPVDPKSAKPVSVQHKRAIAAETVPYEDSASFPLGLSSSVGCKAKRSHPVCPTGLAKPWSKFDVRVVRKTGYFTAVDTSVAEGKCVRLVYTLGVDHKGAGGLTCLEPKASLLVEVDFE